MKDLQDKRYIQINQFLKLMNDTRPIKTKERQRKTNTEINL